MPTERPTWTIRSDTRSTTATWIVAGLLGFVFSGATHGRVEQSTRMLAAFWQGVLLSVGAVVIWLLLEDVTISIRERERMLSVTPSGSPARSGARVTVDPSPAPDPTRRA